MLARQPAARMPGVPVLLRELQRLEEALGLGSGAVAGSDEPTASAPPADPEPGPRTPAPVQSAADEFQHRPITDREMREYDRAMRERKPRPERSSRSRPAIFAALALVLAALGIGLTDFLGLTGFMDDWPGRIERSISASRMQEAPATAAAPSQSTAPPPVAEATKEPAPAPAAPEASPPLAAEPDPPAQTESSVAREPAQTATAGAAPDPEPQPGGTARLILAVSPRGELYIDGKHHGTTPPVTTLELDPGMHRIEVRSGSRKPYLTYMTVQAGDVRRIRHDFNAKPSRPPR
jgi:hypothetical protein